MTAVPTDEVRQMQVTLEREGHLAIITLNAPERLNAIDAAMGRELDQALVEAGTDDTVRAILLTGAGTGFCAGASMERLEEVTADGGAKRGSSIDLAAAFPGVEQALCRRYTLPLAIPKPVVAAVNGACAGAGLSLALACDVRLGSSKARFIASFARMGLAAEQAIAFLLPRIVGMGFASDMLLSARPIAGEEALRVGLVSQLCESDTFPAFAREYARTLADHRSPRSMAAIKRQLRFGLSATLGQSVDDAAALTTESFGWGDLTEGVAAFRERREPKFT
jgi:enoyl-CoA hydratase/carnithine racemase